MLSDQHQSLQSLSFNIENIYYPQHGIRKPKKTEEMPGKTDKIQLDAFLSVY